MDEAFIPLHRLLPALLPLSPPIEDAARGIRQTITACEVTTPIELDLTVTGGQVQIGAAPPLYHLETSLAPVLHAVRIVVVTGESDG
ncbi:MAG: hypothetical protein QM708_14120 [Propioniciclava sp.]|uniref:hypothetical protein n=1 Tax=Propioniciclava sp. TaxID=2038686 RepID=UPI0039E54B93